MLALVSGRGALPAAVAHAAAEAPLVCVLDGFAPDRLSPNITFRLEHLGSFFRDLKSRGVTEVCLCGAIERPVIDPSAIDAATLPLVPIMMQAMGSGDDAALRAVLALFESQGFSVKAAHEIAPALLAPEGQLSTTPVTEAMKADIARADAVLAALGSLDVGQGCIVGAGQVWAIETIGGTDHMLRTLPQGANKARALLVKRPKAQQDRRVDLPTIGPETMDALAEAGLAGVIIDAGQVILLDLEETRRRADAAGLVLWSRDPG